jgi:alanyl-tRNA synthetase
VGLVSILGEASVGSGSRRLEALVGFEAFKALSAEAQIVGQILESLKVPKQELAVKVRQTLEQLKKAEKKLAALALESFRSQIPALIKSVKTVGKFDFLHYSAGEDMSVEQVREMATGLSQALESKASIVAVTAFVDSKIVLIVATSSNARELGVSSGNLVKVASGILGGGGGGKDNIAQGGGPETSKLKEAIAALEKELNS